MWNPFRKKEPEAEVVEMTPVEKNVIWGFAEGDEALRETAIDIYYRYLPTIGVRGGSPEMNFMSEVDNIIPDYALRAHYREVLLDK